MSTRLPSGYLATACIRNRAERGYAAVRRVEASGVAVGIGGRGRGGGGGAGWGLRVRRGGGGVEAVRLGRGRGDGARGRGWGAGVWGGLALRGGRVASRGVPAGTEQRLGRWWLRSAGG